VRALLVQGTSLFISGEFTVPSTDIANFTIYDLVHNTWASSGMPTLQPASGASVVVRSISASTAKVNTVIVAGSFAQVGSLQCHAICSWDVVEKQWNALGSSIQGDVTSVAYAGVRLWRHVSESIVKPTLLLGCTVNQDAIYTCKVCMTPIS
jgi:hypothetical protein